MTARSPFARISLHVGDDSRAECFTYDKSSPILDIRAGNASVAISFVRKAFDDDTIIRFARELAQQAALFAAEAERLHAKRAAPDTTDTPDLAA